MTHTTKLEDSMPNRATATFKIDGWDEQTLAEMDDGRKLTRASVKQTLSGDIEGAGSVEWLMCYRPDKTADFVGLQRISGALGDKSGGFVLVQTAGTFDGKVAKGDLSVAPNSGTGQLHGLEGKGEFSAPYGSAASITLDYDFD
jgi:Protein of unknown function (DUF3224)